MKRASSSCGLFIKKKEKAKEENPYQCSSSLTGCTLSLCPSVTKKNLYGTSRSYREYGKKKYFVERIFNSDVILQSTDDDVKFAFIFFTVYVALCFAVLQFHDAALIKTTQDTQTGRPEYPVYVPLCCAAPQRATKSLSEGLEQYSLRCLLGQKSPLFPQWLHVSVDRPQKKKEKSKGLVCWE